MLANQANSAFHSFWVNKWLASWNRMCATVWRHLVKNYRGNHNNDSLPSGGWLKVTCGLTACTPGSAPGPTLGNEYGRTLPFLLAFLPLTVAESSTLKKQYFIYRLDVWFRPHFYHLINIHSHIHTRTHTHTHTHLALLGELFWL